jgi:hypothetical protein
MKYLFLLLLSICFLSSCDKEDIDFDSTEVGGGTMAKGINLKGVPSGFLLARFTWMVPQIKTSIWGQFGD